MRVTIGDVREAMKKSLRWSSVLHRYKEISPATPETSDVLYSLAVELREEDEGKHRQAIVALLDICVDLLRKETTTRRVPVVEMLVDVLAQSKIGEDRERAKQGYGFLKLLAVSTRDASRGAAARSIGRLQSKHPYLS